MIKGLVLVSQAYLCFATAQTLERAAAQARLSLVLDVDEEIYPVLVPHVSKVYRLQGSLRRGVKPAFEVGQLADIVRAELAEIGGDPADLRIFCQSENNVVPAAHVRRMLGITGDGPELVERFRDKVLMKEMLAASMPEVLPRFRCLDVLRAEGDPEDYFAELVAELGTDTLLVKPTSGSGSLNVAIISGPEDLALTVKRIRADPREFVYEVDELLRGTMYQCDSYVRDGKVAFLGIQELGCSAFDFVKGRTYPKYPMIDEKLCTRLFAFNQDVVTALGFRDGSTHHEMFMRWDGSEPVPKFIEIAARVPGGVGVRFHELNSGVNLIDACLWLALGDPLADTVTPVPRNNVVLAYLPVGHGTIVALSEPDVASPYTIEWRVRVGDVVDSRSLLDIAGILTLVNDDPSVLRRDFERLGGYVPVTCA